MDVRYHPTAEALRDDITKVRPFPENPRNGDTDAIIDSIRVNGCYRPVYAWAKTGEILAGNHLYHSLAELGETRIPIAWIEADTRDEAVRILLGDNQIASLGGFDDALLLDLVKGLDETLGLLGSGFDQAAIDALLARVEEDMYGTERDAELEAGQKRAPKKRQLPLDLILSINAGGSHAEAMAGFRLGWQSGVMTSHAGSARIFYERYPRAPRLGFMDNEWHDYDHASHVAALAEFNPKYATTRDLLTKDQADEAGVEWLSIEETLEQAAEVAAHTDNVILIPKYACLDRLPETIDGKRVVLGYSVESSYGGTPLPITAFRGRPIHLLGGPWAKQRAYLNLMGDDIVSLDNNNVLHVARFGQVCKADGEVVPLDAITGNPYQMAGRHQFTALVMSLHFITHAVVADYGVDVEAVEVGEEEAP